MGTLREYFEMDGSRTLCLHKPLQIKSAEGETELEIVGRLHIDFESNAKYISYYIPSTDMVVCPARIVLNSLDQVLGLLKEVGIQGSSPGEEPMRASATKFTGRVFIYSEDPISEEDIAYIKGRAAELENNVQFRFKEYAESRSEWEKPLAFISHDSRDKGEIAGPLARELQKLMCPVWYDEFSLKVGDSLRENIEQGIKECKKCIFNLTPNFLANGGWARREYDSTFTRELVENKKVILPVWHNVTYQDVYEYSPILADRKASKWESGVEAVAKELEFVIRA